jgi:protein-export membrane protein SecD
MDSVYRQFLLIIFMTIVAAIIALPKSLPINFEIFGKPISYTISAPIFDFSFFGKRIYKEFELKRGLDIQGGMQVVLEADMSEIDEEDRGEALKSAREIIVRRVDMYGLTEPVVRTLVSQDSYRIVVELPGLDDPEQALELVGQTAQLDFQLVSYGEPEIILDLEDGLDELEIDPSQLGMILIPTDLQGSQLKRSTVQFDPNTGEPIVAIEFNPEGRDIFAEITTNHTGEQLAILIDGIPIMAPVIQTPIIDGQATITGGFTLEDAQTLSIQLNAGALPAPISVLEQRSIDATLGEESVRQSVKAGVIGLLLVMSFMILYYGTKGLIASLALLIFVTLTFAIYKIIGVTLTLPGVAGMLLTTGMAVDANILTFERMKEELKLGKPFIVAQRLGFIRAWTSIKSASTATIISALVLINPIDLPFLNTSGSVRGFGITLLLGVLIALFTGMVVTKNFMEIFLKDTRKNR